MSSDEAMEQYNSRLLNKALTGTTEPGGSWDAGSGDGKHKSDVDHSNKNDMTPGAHRVKDEGQYVTVLDRKLAAREDKKSAYYSSSTRCSSDYSSTKARASTV